jgi:uncharacterized protein YhaN
MRFRRFELVRYGGFADRVLDFGDGTVDLHLVVGPNEAGKSTMLAAIGDLLFGIPERSPQNWRYDYGDLRIRASIIGPAGEVDVTRRKGKRNTLLAPDGTALPDDLLAPLLNGMDRRSFERMFGLDHAKLREGGEAILEGKDDAARIVLEAGTGFAGIGRELKKLDEQAGALFKPSAQIPTVNRLMRERTDALADVRTHSVGDSDWIAIKARREAADIERAALVEEGRTLAQRAHAIERINRIRPLLARRSSEQEALAGLGIVPLMPDDAGDRLAAALAERRTAGELHARETAKRDRARDVAAAIDLPMKLLAAKAEIETLFGRLAVAEKAGEDLVARKVERAAIVDRLSRVRADAGLDVDHPIPGAGPRKRLRTMIEVGRRLESDTNRHHQNRQAIEDESARLAPAEADALAETWLDALRSAVDAVGSDVARRATSLAAARDRAGARLENGVAGLAPWSGSVEALRSAVPPGAVETVAAAAAIDGGQASLRSAEADIVDHEQELIGLRSELASLAASGTLPTPEIVAAARAARDELVDEVRARLGGDRADDDARIGEALRVATGQADRLADSRDADAQRVAQHGVLRGRQAEIEARLAAARNIVAVETGRLHDRMTSWADLLRQIGFQRPVPPGDLDRWRAERERTLSLADELAAATLACAEFDAERAAKRAAVDAALRDAGIVAAPGDALDDRVALARRELARLDAVVRARGVAEAQRRRIDDALDKANHEALDLQARQTAYEADRTRLLQESRLPDHGSADALSDAIDAFEELAGDQATLSSIERQIAFDEDQLGQFEAAFDALQALLDGPRPDRRFERLRALNDALAEAVRSEETLRQLGETEQDAVEALAAIERRLRSADAVVAELIAVAGAATEAALAGVIEAGRQVRAHEGELRRLAQELEHQCEGLELAVVAQEAAALSPDEAAAELEDIRIRRQEIEEARETVGRDLASAEAEIAGVASATAAADAQQEAFAVAAAMADAAERHVEAASAAALLRWVIDRHRATAQAPLIERAGAMFAQVTAGAFTGLVLDYDDSDRPLIKGLRADASRVGVDGMSEGTRDQLYLALRLGAIASRGGSQALPVVCDDLLITADDGRAAEMLRVLAAAAKENQVILFSHHDHIVDIAEAAVGKHGFRLHRIGRNLDMPGVH